MGVCRSSSWGTDLKVKHEGPTQLHELLLRPTCKSYAWCELQSILQHAVSMFASMVVAARTHSLAIVQARKHHACH